MYFRNSEDRRIITGLVSEFMLLNDIFRKLHVAWRSLLPDDVNDDFEEVRKYRISSFIALHDKINALSIKEVDKIKAFDTYSQMEVNDLTH